MQSRKRLQAYVSKRPDCAAARQLASLDHALRHHSHYSLPDLCLLESEPFEIAIDVLREWRGALEYADRLRLLSARDSSERSASPTRTDPR